MQIGSFVSDDLQGFVRVFFKRFIRIFMLVMAASSAFKSDGRLLVSFKRIGEWEKQINFHLLVVSNFKCDGYINN